jgi:hypothetical protein
MLTTEDPWLFAKQKAKAVKMHGCSFTAAQGIEAEPKTFSFWFAEFALRE